MGEHPNLLKLRGHRGLILFIWLTLLHLYSFSSFSLAGPYRWHSICLKRRLPHRLLRVGGLSFGLCVSGLLWMLPKTSITSLVWPAFADLHYSVVLIAFVFATSMSTRRRPFRSAPYSCFHFQKDLVLGGICLLRWARTCIFGVILIAVAIHEVCAEASSRSRHLPG